MQIRTDEQLRKFISEVFEEVESQVIDAIKTIKDPAKRLELLNQVDALTLLQDEIYARFNRPNIFNA